MEEMIKASDVFERAYERTNDFFYFFLAVKIGQKEKVKIEG